MLSLDPRTRALAGGLAALAGYVDAAGFISLGGFFVSFMSGNSTRLAVGTAQGSASAFEALGLILIFVLGVATGTRVTRHSRQPRVVVIAGVALLIALAALLGTAGCPVAAGIVLALAMGFENAAFVADGGLPVGLTYMTGTLVKMGQQLGSIGSADDAARWWPYAVHWIALMAGAVAGAIAFRAYGYLALWLAAVGAGVLAMLSRQQRTHPASG